VSLKLNNKINNVVILFIFLSLLLSFFNQPPVYPLFVFIVIGFVIVSIVYFINKNYNILAIQFYSFLIALYFMYSGIILSKMPINEVLDYEFFRHDGNYFISFMPLMILPFLRKVDFNINFNKLIFTLITVVSIITFGIIILILINNFSCEERCNVCHFLFKAHNAAGGYYMILSLISFFYWKYYKKNKLFLIFFIINFVALIMTYSRGSMIGFFLALIYYFLEVNNKNKLKHLLNITIAMTLGLIYYIGYSLSINDIDISFYKSGTIMDRVFNLWPRAIQDFFYSPLFGIGYTRYDDLPYNFYGIKYVYYINISEYIKHTDAHAHNSFLHILAETGIIGLVLWILLFRSIFKYTKKIFVESKYNYYFIKYGLIAIIFSGFTEHRWTTPAEVLPYTIYLSLFIILRKSNEKNIIYK